MPKDNLPQRHTPTKGVHISLGGPNWVFLTVCTQGRARWLAQSSIQRALHDILMPDHLHLFCAPRGGYAVGPSVCTPDDRQGVPTDAARDADHLAAETSAICKYVAIERWLSFWKDQLAKKCPEAEKFQRGGFHHRLRDSESYSEKWQYVRENPIRAGLAATVEEWPYQGRVHDLRW
jgi:hypothetical protein